MDRDTAREDLSCAQQRRAAARQQLCRRRFDAAPRPRHRGCQKRKRLAAHRAPINNGLKVTRRKTHTHTNYRQLMTEGGCGSVTVCGCTSTVSAAVSGSASLFAPPRGQGPEPQMQRGGRARAYESATRGMPAHREHTSRCDTRSGPTHGGHGRPLNAGQVAGWPPGRASTAPRAPLRPHELRSTNAPDPRTFAGSALVFFGTVVLWPVRELQHHPPRTTHKSV